MKSKEELLSEEVRAAGEIASKNLQWGVTLMISIQTALFFVRREILDALIDAGKLPKGSDLPLSRYFIGTAFLLFVAFILSKFTARTNQQYRHYKKQLIECRSSGIADLPIRYTGKWAYFLYFAFPVIDIFVRMIIRIGFQ